MKAKNWKLDWRGNFIEGCPLDITAYYLDYPQWFVDYLKSRSYFGYWFKARS